MVIKIQMTNDFYEYVIYLYSSIYIIGIVHNAHGV